MYVKKNFGFKRMMELSGGHLVWLTLWALLATCFIEGLHVLGYECFKVPWLPLSVIGTAVAFYLGFKNNSSYDCMWEARKILGAIVNISRMWGVSVKGFVSNQFTEKDIPQTELDGEITRLIYRHIGWLYSLRSQLLIPTSWEHINQSKMVRKVTQTRIDFYGVGQFTDQTTKEILPTCLPKDEVDRLLNAQNTATQIIDQQSQDLKILRERKIINDFRHMEPENILNDFYTHQGKAERFKKFPFPRQYGSMSYVFVGLYIFLLPFGMVTEFHDYKDFGDWGAWLSIPFTVIVGWVFLMMELIGDYSENPFEGLGNDIPMLSLCRTIEIDLKEMLGETNLPPKIEVVKDVLM